MRFFIILMGLFFLVYGLIHLKLIDQKTMISGLSALAVASFAASRHLKKYQSGKRLNQINRSVSESMPVQVKQVQPISSIRTSIQEPLKVENPVLGMLNLMDKAGDNILFSDYKNFGELFSKNVIVETKKIPRCNVLFLYCSFESSGRISGQEFYLRDVIKAAGAYIVVIASEVNLEVFQSSGFQSYINNTKQNWPANIVFTLNRNGEYFGNFFRQLFTHMFNGITMPLAWVKLAPQGPNQQSNVPGTIVMLDGGHISFSN
jgi:hypothetical protein